MLPLVFEPSASIPDHQSLWPRVVFVESGSMTIGVDGADWQIKRAGSADYDPVEAKESESQDVLGQGDAAYIPPGAAVSMNDGGGEQLGTLLSLTLVPPEVEATPLTQHDVETSG